MTWSIIARDNDTGQFGIAVATRFFAVGARVPYIAAGVGGVATQALVNPYYGIDGLKLLREGHAPRDAVEMTCPCRFPPVEVRVRPSEGRTDEAIQVYGRTDYWRAARA
jgi:hypothetical protein